VVTVIVVLTIVLVGVAVFIAVNSRAGRYDTAVESASPEAVPSTHEPSGRQMEARMLSVEDGGSADPGEGSDSDPSTGPGPVEPTKSKSRLTVDDEAMTATLEVWGLTDADDVPVTGFPVRARVRGTTLAEGIVGADGRWFAGGIELKKWMDNGVIVVKVGGVELKTSPTIVLPGDEQESRPETDPPDGVLVVNGEKVVFGTRSVVGPVEDGSIVEVSYDITHDATDLRTNLLIRGHGVELDPTRPSVDGVILDRQRPDYVRYLVGQPQTFHEAGGDKVLFQVRAVERVDNDPRTVSVELRPPSGNILRARVRVGS